MSKHIEQLVPHDLGGRFDLGGSFVSPNAPPEHGSMPDVGHW